jgi:hypothetical protein
VVVVVVIWESMGACKQGVVEEHFVKENCG